MPNMPTERQLFSTLVGFWKKRYPGDEWPDHDSCFVAGRAFYFRRVSQEWVFSVRLQRGDFAVKRRGTWHDVVLGKDFFVWCQWSESSSILIPTPEEWMEIQLLV